MMKTNTTGKLSYPGMVMDRKAHAYVPPRRVVRATGTVNAESLLEQAQVQTIVNPHRELTVIPPGGELILDFGRELHGQLLLTTGGMPNDRQLMVDVTLGESVSETLGTPTMDHAVHQLSMAAPTLGQVYFGNSAFRFVRLTLAPDAPHALSLQSAVAVAVYQDWEYRGYFESDDSLLNRIWQTGAYTVHLNCQDYIYDGVKRDRLVWMGDLYPEIRTLLAVFDETDLIEKSLDFMRDTTVPPEWMNGISSYSCWWLICQRDLYFYRGNYAYLERQRSALSALLRQLLACVEADGREQLTGWRFLDWSTADDEQVKHAGLQGLLAWTLQAGVFLATELALPALAERCRTAVNRLHRQSPDCCGNKVAAAMLALGGVSDPTALNRRIFSVDPCRGISTFYGYFVLQARALAGDTAGAVELIRNYWGGMLKFGATTFWEDFDLDWTKNAYGIDSLPVAGKQDIHGDFGKHCYVGLRHSLCHGWAGGPTAFLSESVMGVRPMAPGCRKVQVAPELPAGVNRLEGGFPTPYGLIEVSARRVGNAIRSKVKLPDEIVPVFSSSGNETLM